MSGAITQFHGLCLSALLVIAPQARADEDQTKIGDVHFLCSQRHFELSLEAIEDGRRPSDSTTVEVIDAAGLVTYGEQDERGDSRRTGSKEVIRQCGRYAIRFRGGFYNGNPQGEMGAAEDYPLIDIWQQDKRIAGPFAMGQCSASNPRESAMAACPSNWVTRVTFHFPFGSSAPHMRLEHVYEEYLDVFDEKQTPSASPSTH